jgi:hypothetical protein
VPGIDVIETLVIDDGSTDRTADVPRVGGDLQRFRSTSGSRGRA